MEQLRIGLVHLNVRHNWPAFLTGFRSDAAAGIFIMRPPLIYLKDKLQPTIGKFQWRRDGLAPETQNNRTVFTGRFVSRPCWSLQLVGLSGIDESVYVFRLRFIQHGAVSHVVATVMGQIIQQLLGMILDLIDSPGF